MIAMAIVVVALGALAIGVIGYLLARGPAATTITEADFDEAYDELVGDGQATDADRKAAWRDFDAWQATNERERLRWEHGADE